MLLALLLIAVSAEAETRMISYPGIGPKLYEVSEIDDVYQEVTCDNSYRCDEGQAIGIDGMVMEYPRAKAQTDAAASLRRAMERRAARERDASQ